MSSTNSFNQAEAYDKTSIQQRREGHKLLQHLAPEKGCKVLDLGCGTGYFSKVLAELVGPEGKVVAIDPDVERLKLAREKYPASNLEYHEGRAQNIPGTDYDIVFANYILHWCEDKDLVFQQVSKSLKPGGKFAFSVCLELDKDFFGPTEHYSAEFMQAVSTELFFPMSMDEYLSIALSHNYKIIYSTKNESRDEFNNVFEFVDFLRMHSRNSFDESHFHTDAMKSYYDEGKIVKLTHELQCILHY